MGLIDIQFPRIWGSWSVRGDKEYSMRYRVHKLEVKKDDADEKLERFLNKLEGEVVSVLPYTSPTFQGMGATSKINFLLIVEKIG